MSHLFPCHDALPRAEHARSAQPGRHKHLWRDPLLLWASLLAGVLASAQWTIIWRHPGWGGLVTDWVLAVLAWLALGGLLWSSVWFSRKERPEARSWWWLSAVLLAHAIAASLWLVRDQRLFPSQMSLPWWSTLFSMLEYPGILVALLIWPSAPDRHIYGLRRLRALLDSLLLMSAAGVLTWSLLLAPLSLASRHAMVGTLTLLAYPIGDLGVLFLLIVMFTRVRCLQAERLTLGVLISAVLLLLVGNAWFATLSLAAPYQAGGPPDGFRMLSTLLVPLAGLVQVRLTQGRTHTPRKRLPVQRLQWHDMVESVRFLMPLVAAFLTSSILIARGLVASSGQFHLIHSLVLSGLLLLVVLVRQEVILLEYLRVRREREAAQTHQLALEQANQQMETFVGIAGHELKTPLTCLKLALQMAERRLQHLLHREAVLASDVAPVQEQVALAGSQVDRLDRRVNDLLDVSRIRAGKFALHLAPADLTAIVRQAFEEQRQVTPDRSLSVQLPAGPLPVTVDAERIGQVVTNFLTNALKYSPEKSPVDVGITADDHQAHVWVQDAGLGIAAEDQERIWDRFYRVKGIEVQSGSGIGLGLGLYICQTIVERHHGHVGVKSTPGHGSTFWFTLPLVPSRSA